MAQASKQGFPDKTKIPKAAFALLFGEIVHYCHQKAGTLDQFGNELKHMGIPIGYTILEVIQQSSPNFKRQTTVVNMLVAVKEKIWPFLFGYQAHNLEQQLDDQNCYMLYDDKPMVTQYISHPQDLRSHFTCCSFVAGILEGLLCSAGFQCTVTAHPNYQGVAPTALCDKVIFVIKFVPE
jgi:hypothetical protein